MSEVRLYQAIKEAVGVCLQYFERERGSSMYGGSAFVRDVRNGAAAFALMAAAMCLSKNVVCAAEERKGIGPPRS